MTSEESGLEPPNRAEGVIRLRFEAHGGRTRAVGSREAGGYRARFPQSADAGRTCEAVLINTGGGMVGGDTALFEVACTRESRVAVTTQSAEKIYRSTGAATRVAAQLSVGPSCHLAWLPQETIVFDRAHLARTLDAAVARDATLLLAETLVFGRRAMGESVTWGEIHDRWRVTRDGRLVFAEDFRMKGVMEAQLGRAAIGNGAHALATLLYLAPDAEARLDPLRHALAAFGDGWGASAWNGFLTLRAAAPSSDMLRRIIVAALEHLRGQPVPCVWQ